MEKCDPSDKKCLTRATRRSRVIALLIAIVVTIILIGTGCECLYSRWNSITRSFKRSGEIKRPSFSSVSPLKCPEHTCPACPPAPACPPLAKCPDCPTCKVCDKCPVCTKCPECPATKMCTKCKNDKHCQNCNAVDDYVAKSKCPHCNNVNPKNICSRCGACDTCKVDDKCGFCQRFERQLSLNERGLPCSLCGQKPCMCPTATGMPVIKEPGCARNGVYSDVLYNMIYI